MKDRLKISTNLYIVIVVYKKELLHCKAFTSMKKHMAKINNLHLIIWNNSPEILIDKNQDDYEYFEAQNSTLPIIYNSMTKKYLKSENDFLMISDDDTDYSNYDFKKLFDILTTNESKTGIFIPQLYANNRLVSPGKRFLFKGKYIQSIKDGLIKSKNILGMNSGLIISYKCFNKMPLLFDERLRFYGTDTDFFIRYEKHFDFLYVLPFKIQHDLSENNNDKERTDFRRKDNLYALNIIFSNRSLIEKLLFKLYYLYINLKAMK